ncbi:MAG: lipopolysaccharide biosynthesis protein [Candidatus Sumerlaeia bacterium]|nr:lipopolysaccharide biosynthesis protein [Candidatus Sumerlaeia bacterium]
MDAAPPTGLRERVVRGGALAVGAQFLRTAVSTLALMALARLVAPEDFGLVAMAGVFTGSLGLFRNIGLETALQREEVLAPGLASNVFWCALAAGCALSLAGLALAPFAAWFYGEPAVLPIAAAAAAVFMLDGVGAVPLALLRRELRIADATAADLAGLLAGSGAAITIALATRSPWSLVAQPLAASAVCGAVAWRRSGFRPSAPIRGTGIRRLIRFGADLLGVRILGYAYGNTESLLLGRAWGPHEVGLYSRANALMLMPLQLCTAPLQHVAVPALSKFQREPERLARAFLDLIEQAALYLLPLVALLVAVPELLVRVVLGPEWVASAGLVRLLALWALVQPFLNMSNWLFLALGKSRAYLRYQVVSVAFVVGGAVLAAPHGMHALAAVFVASGFCLRLPLYLWFLGRHTPVSAADFLRALLPFLAATVAGLGAFTGVAAALPMASESGTKAVALCVGAACHAAVLALFPRGREVLRRTRGLVRSLLERRG